MARAPYERPKARSRAALTHALRPPAAIAVDERVALRFADLHEPVQRTARWIADQSSRMEDRQPGRL
jgi:hypothetical protein